MDFDEGVKIISAQNYAGVDKPCSFFSQTADSNLLGQSPHSLCSFDETTQYLMAARNHGRSWEKYVRAHGRKRSCTPKAHHAQAASETTSMQEGGSVAPRTTARMVRIWKQAHITKVSRYFEHLLRNKNATG